MIYLAVSKGRIMELVLHYLKKKGIYLLNKNSRKIVLNTNIKKIKIVPLKANDAFKYLKSMSIDCCIMGNDTYLENNKFLYKFKKINIFKCRLSIISKYKRFLEEGKVTFFTKYLNISRNFCIKNNLNFNIIKMNGTLELAIYFKISNYIIDIIDTGVTLKENNLIEIKKIKNIYSIIVFSKIINNKKIKILKKIFLFK
ncbi:ATP phosphoribosyltransferase [Candidatus Vidania fulgoroideorum]